MSRTLTTDLFETVLNLKIKIHNIISLHNPYLMVFLQLTHKSEDKIFRL